MPLGYLAREWDSSSRLCSPITCFAYAVLRADVEPDRPAVADVEPDRMNE